APPALTDGVRKVHDFLTVGAAAPLQHASAVALGAGEDYYQRLASDYDARRRKLIPMLEAAGFHCYPPKGAYDVMTDISGFGFRDDYAFARHLLENVGFIGVPGSSFYGGDAGSQQMRFCFCKRFETLDAAGERLERLRRG
ncbi:MAG: aminotransferase class I/II-fold pyridoxal phosphate-dependent enzyme, partial [Acidobacteria bacterium]|nr:aminotransferase class I/II-fold pyridoxal phosphate-dependent enzyme [Acidobacteriota bacterium]